MATIDRTDDGQLLARIAKKDRTAVSVLFARYQTPVYRFLHRMVRNDAIAQELVNETFIEIWRAAGKFEGRSKPSTWIFAIARFKALSVLRKRSDEELDEVQTAKIEDDADTPEVTTMKGDKAELLRQCLEKLSQSHREVVDLVYYHEKSITEISEILDVAAGTVKTRLFHARKQLSGMMASAGIDRGWP